MIWRDILYFSSGEKRALIVLSVLVILAICLLALQGREPVSGEQANVSGSPGQKETPEVRPDAERQDSYPTGSGSVEQSFRSVAVPSSRTSGHSYFSRSVNRAQTSRTRPGSPSRPKNDTSLRKSYAAPAKYAPGTVVELNGADSASLRKVPGIGEVFAGRIIKFRRLLGGFHTVGQLREVYGLTEERYLRLSPWFSVDSSRIERLHVNTLSSDSLIRHPYLNGIQVRELLRMRSRKGRLSGWNDLALLEEFTQTDRQRLFPYLSFD